MRHKFVVICGQISGVVWMTACLSESSKQQEHVDAVPCPVQHVLHERLCLFVLNNFDAVLASPAARTMRLTPMDLTHMAISPILPVVQ